MIALCGQPAFSSAAIEKLRSGAAPEWLQHSRRCYMAGARAPWLSFFASISQALNALTGEEGARALPE